MTRSDDGPDRISAGEIKAIIRVRGLAELYERRPDLTGVYPPADLIAEAVRWSA